MLERLSRAPALRSHVLERLSRIAGVRSTNPLTPALLLSALATSVGFTWGLPGSDSWAADSISPRSCGLGAIVETYLPGHFHVYPPLHMALLTVLSAPWIVLGVLRVGTSIDALGAELIKPLYMTGIELAARALAGAMALGTIWNSSRLWTRFAGKRAGAAAAIAVALNPTLVYYAHTGNLEVPYLFWITLALVEMDRVMCGEPRETAALATATAAVLTKDQAAAALVLPLVWALIVVPRVLRRPTAFWTPLGRGAAIAIGTYALLSGAVVNPTGFRRRLAFLFGPASRTWAGYPPGLRGTIRLVVDSVHATGHLTSWPIAVAAAVGLALALVRPPARVSRARLLLPCWAALSFAALFLLTARRSEDRFLLPESLFLCPYCALTYDLAASGGSTLRRIAAVGAVAACVPALLGVASIDATLLADPRYSAERWLAALPGGTHVEVYGGPIFLPRVPSTLVAVRPGIEPIDGRQAIAGVTDLVDPAMDPRPRSPAIIVLATELSNAAATQPPPASQPFALAQYRDARSHGLFRALSDGSYDYLRTLRATCQLPWPLECRRVHDSTAGEVWIYARGGADVAAPTFVASPGVP